MLRDKRFMEVRALMIWTGINLATEIKRNMKSYLLLIQTNQKSLRKEMFPVIIKSIERWRKIQYPRPINLTCVICDYSGLNNDFEKYVKTPIEDSINEFRGSEFKTCAYEVW